MNWQLWQEGLCDEMNGKYHIIVQNRYLKYEFDIKRNLTMIQGDSATGKTTLVNMIREYSLGGRSSGVQLSCEKPCRVLEGDLWKELLQIIQNTIIFIDEDNDFIETKEFAEAIQGSTNYFVIVTRENLEMLPISITEVYGIKSSGRYGSLRPVYHEMYHIYDFGRENLSQIVPKCFITEDSNSGFEFFSYVAKQNGISCISANGKSNIYGMIVGEKYTEDVLIIADGAAFASQMNRIRRIVERNPHIHLFLPESFEWIILQSDVLNDAEIREILAQPEKYIYGEKWSSWERFFTNLLVEKSKGSYLNYTKKKLNDNYLHGNIQKKILSVLEGIEIQSKDA